MMNVCLVDDQRAVVDSLKNGIHWEKLPGGQGIYGLHCQRG